MKKLLIILSILCCWFAGESQVNYKLPYDSVTTKKPNGVGFLNAAKGKFADSLWHQITLALGDSSKLSATTEWVKRQNFGSGGGTPSLPNRSVQINQNGSFHGTDSMIYNNGSLILKHNDSIGDIFRYSWATNPLTTWSDNTSTATLTTDGTTTTISGAGLGYNLNNYINLPRFVGVENYTWTDTIKIIQLDHTSFGLMFNIPEATGMGNGVSAHLLLSDTAGYWAYNNQTVVPDFINTSKATSSLVWSLNDLFEIKIQKIQRTFIFTARNLRNGSTTSYQVDNIFPQVGQPHIYFYSPTQLVSQFVMRYDAIRRAKLAIFSDSIGWGGNATDYLKKYFSIIEGSTGGYGVTNSGPGEFSAQGVSRIADLQSELPDIALYGYGVNDFSNSVTAATFSTNVQAFVQAAQAQGTFVALLSLVPQTSGSVVTFNDTLHAIATRYGCLYIDFYTLLKGAGTAMNAIYNSGDGIHPNNLGHIVIAQAIVTALQPYIGTNTSPLVVQAPQTNVTRFNTLVLDDQNNVLQRPNFTDPQYILNQPSFDAQHIQVGTINVSGPVAAGTIFLAKGTGNDGNPDFCVNCSTNPFLVGVTIANKIFTGNFSTGIGAVGSSFSGGIVYFTNDGITASQIQTQGQALLYTFNTPQSASNGMILRPGHQTGHAGPGWTPFQIQGIDSLTQFSFDSLANPYIKYFRDGSAASTDSVVVVINGHLGVKTVSGGGGSSLFPTSGTGTASADVTGDMGGFNFELSNAANIQIATAAGSVNLGSTLILEDDRGTPHGFQYDGDYAAGFTSRSIPDVGYFGKLGVSLIPATDNAVSLGSGSKEWINTYLANGGAIIWNNGTSSITSTGGSSMAINVDNGLIQVYKSGQASNLQLYNTTITDGLNFKTSPSFEIKTLSNAGSIVMISSSGEKLGIGSAPTSKLSVFGSFGLMYNSTATGITLDDTYGTVQVTATGQTITLPTAVGITGRIYTIKLTAVGSCTVATTSSQTIDASTTYSLSAQYKDVTVQSNGANWLIISNN